jgi:hypothetical protein
LRENIYPLVDFPSLQCTTVNQQQLDRFGFSNPLDGRKITG